MSTKNLIFPLLVILSLTIMGCEDNTSGSNKSFPGGDNFIITNPVEDGASETFVYYKSSVQYAELDEILEAEAECNGNSDQICVYVCHRPPGNPANEKTKILPIKALTAHLNHGADHHHDHDYIGPCVSDFDDSDPDVVIDEDPDAGGNNGSDGGDDSGNDSGDNGGDDSNEEVPDDSSNDGYGTDVPTWCDPFFSIDQDCDGYDDETFAPTF